MVLPHRLTIEQVTEKQLRYLWKVKDFDRMPIKTFNNKRHYLYSIGLPRLDALAQAKELTRAGLRAKVTNYLKGAVEYNIWVR
jgi:hypothetical protein